MAALDDENCEECIKHGHCRDHFFKFPNLIIIQRNILPYFTIIELFGFRCVSKLCNAVVKDYWHIMDTINCINCCTCITTAAFDLMTKDSKNISHLTLSNCELISERSIIKFLEQNPELLFIDLTGCNITASTMEVIAENCSDVIHLNLYQCQGITNQSLIYLSENCAFLQYIDISDCHLIDDSGIEELVEYCPDLRTIVLAGLDISDDIIYTIAENCKVLVELDIEDCGITPTAKRFIKKKIPDLNLCF